MNPPCKITKIATKNLKSPWKLRAEWAAASSLRMRRGTPATFFAPLSFSQRHKSRSGHFVGRGSALRMCSRVATPLAGGRATWRAVFSFPIGHRARARPRRVLIGCLEAALSADWLRGGVSLPESGGLSVFGKRFVTLQSALVKEIESVKAAIHLSCGAPRCLRLWHGSSCRRVCALRCP